MVDEKKEIQARITGKVQMVMYRDFVQRKARMLGLVGTVQNLSDGSVQIVAQGSEEKLKEFIKELHDGPFLAKVDAVQVEWQDPKKSFTEFSIVY